MREGNILVNLVHFCLLKSLSLVSLTSEELVQFFCEENFATNIYILNYLLFFLFNLYLLFYMYNLNSI